MLTGYRLDVRFLPDAVTGDVSPCHAYTADITSGAFPPFDIELHRTYHFVEPDVERLLDVIKTWAINYTRSRHEV